jgi:iron complex transport system ATP-binding protein
MLEFNGVTIRRKGFTLEDVSLKIKPHKLTVILGKNGSGKSTLISAVNGEVDYTGSVSFSGRDLRCLSERERATLVSIMPQNLPVVPFTVFEIATFGINPYLDFTGKLNAEQLETVNNALKTTGAYAFKERFLSEISGGEKQLAYLTSALCQNSRVMIFDEPTAFIDMDKEALFFAIIKNQIEKNKKTVLMTMHNVTSAIRYANDVIVLNDGKIEFFGSKEDAVSSGVIERVFSVTHSVTNGVDVYLSK